MRPASSQSPFGQFLSLSLEDLVANLTRLVLDLGEGAAVPSKHARDFLRLIDFVGPDEAEVAGGIIGKRSTRSHSENPGLLSLS
jgi:hypothetical protein